MRQSYCFCLSLFSSRIPEELTLRRPSFVFTMCLWDVSLTTVSCVVFCSRGLDGACACFFFRARESGDPSKAKDCLPDKSKQFLVTRNGEGQVRHGFVCAGLKNTIPLSCASPRPPPPRAPPLPPLPPLPPIEYTPSSSPSCAVVHGNCRCSV